MRWRSFLSASRIRVELIRLIGRHVFVCIVKGCLVAAGYHSKHLDRCPRLPPDRRCHCRMFADRPQNWNHQHWSYAIFNIQSMVSCYHSDHHDPEFHVFLWCKNTFAFQQHNAKLGHIHCSCTGWLWISTNSTWDQCWWFQFCCSGDDSQGLVRCIGMDVLSEIQLLLNIIQREGKDTAFSSSD